MDDARERAAAFARAHDLALPAEVVNGVLDGAWRARSPARGPAVQLALF